MLDVNALIQDMTLEEKIGQLFLLAFSSDRLDEARVLMEEHFVGAAYISNDNVPNPAAAVQMAQRLQGFAANTRLKIPLLLGVDQEGAWSVMTPGSCPGPGNMALGATHNPDDAYAMYRVIGHELVSVGLNTLLAPCADCNSNPQNSIIGMRSFGESPELVGQMATAAVRGAHDAGAITAIKHFPGHGDTTSDSHRDLPTVNRSREDLFAIDLYPFREGVAAGSDMVMTSHIVFPALDAENPATLSRIILHDVLRGEMGFDGVILSDSMNMQAMRKHYAPEDSAIRAFNAGVDLLMLAEEHYNHDAATYLQQQTSIIRAVKQAVEDGTLPLERVHDALRRVLRVKAKLPAAPTVSADPVGSAEHRQVELQVSRDAVAILRNNNGLLPLAPTKSFVLVNTTSQSSYAVLGSTRGIGPNQTTPAFDSFAEAVRQRVPDVAVFSAESVLDGSAAIPADAVIVAVTENYPLPGMDFDQRSQPQVIGQLLKQAADRLIVVALRDPYELTYLTEVPTYLCAFSFRPCAAQAAAEVLFGEQPARGKSPVSIPQ